VDTVASIFRVEEEANLETSMEQAANRAQWHRESFTLNFVYKRPENSELGGDKRSPNLIVHELVIEPFITLVMEVI
jgi:hypothetical protein